jgi:uncharacterized protein (DUF1499 family)
MTPARVARITLAAAITALVLLLAAGSGYRGGLWSLGAAFAMIGGAALLAVVTLLVALIALVRTSSRRAAARPLVLALVLAAGTSAWPALTILRARDIPPIHDVTTDLADPPRFVDVLPLRAAAPNSPEHPGDSVAALQRSGYPDLGPATLDAPPAVAFSRARDAAAAMGWALVAADSAAGRIEATATTRWFGFKDDVVIRVRAADGGSRVDVRSVSRLGVSDLGANAARIRAFLARLQR